MFHNFFLGLVFWVAGGVLVGLLGLIGCAGCDKQMCCCEVRLKPLNSVALCTLYPPIYSLNVCWRLHVWCCRFFWSCLASDRICVERQRFFVQLQAAAAQNREQACIIQFLLITYRSIRISCRALVWKSNMRGITSGKVKTASTLPP